jgi:uridine kinase
MRSEKKALFFVGIAGGSGSGKTTFARKIQEKILINKHDEVALLHFDSYYLKKASEELRIHGKPNFDHPEAFDWELLRKHLGELKQGKSVKVPIYDFKANQRTEQTTSVGPCRAILMEGIYVLWDLEVRNLFNLKIYLIVDADIRFIRRLHRDVKERGRSVDSIIRQYYDSVRPMHREYLDPTKQYADFIIGEETDVASEVVAARVNAAITGHDH